MSTVVGNRYLGAKLLDPEILTLDLRDNSPHAVRLLRVVYVYARSLDDMGVSAFEVDFAHPGKHTQYQGWMWVRLQQLAMRFYEAC